MVGCARKGCGNHVSPPSKFCSPRIAALKKYCSALCAGRVAKAAWKRRNAERHRESERARKRRKYETDATYRAKVLTHCAASYQHHREARRLKAATDPIAQEKNRIAARAWRASRRTDPAKRFYTASVAARRRSCTRKGKVTNEDWIAIKAAHGNACAYCGCTDRPLTMDHVVALLNGGAHEPGNIVPACRPCNSSKGTSTRTACVIRQSNRPLLKVAGDTT